jgi:AraC family transcriptional regulator of adaptative response/methylated-DNA-[protein]-cysteine methyltransferase
MPWIIHETDTSAWAARSPKPAVCANVHSSPWGLVLVGLVDGQLAAFHFVAIGREKAALSGFSRHWPGATLASDPAETARALAAVVAGWRGGRETNLPLLLKGTPFQRRVWRALLEIPRGTTVTYGELARRLKNPRASRAVGQAVGANPLAVLVPCHRVLAANGALGGFAWGPEMKRALLAGEGVAA